MDVTTERLTLHPLTRDEAVARAAADIPAEERWGTGYPVVDQRSALTSFVEMWDEVGDTRPFGVYDVCERETGDQVGGVAFFGPEKPSDPADAQATTLPLRSVTVTTVLL